MNPRHPIWRLFAIAVICLTATVSTRSDDSDEAKSELAKELSQAQKLVEQRLNEYAKLQAAGAKPETLRQSRSELLRAMSASVEIELRAREQRIDAARKRLDALEEKLKLSRAMIDRLAESRVRTQLAKRESIAQMNPLNPDTIPPNVRTLPAGGVPGLMGGEPGRRRGEPGRIASTPGAGSPDASTPSASTPGASTPGASTPGASTPGAGTAGAGTAGAGTAGAGTAGAGTAGAGTAGAGTAGASTPGASTPGATTMGEKVGEPPRVFGQPQAVLDAMQICIEAGDMKGLVELLDDEAALELAGCMLISTAGMSIVGQFADSIPENMDRSELAAMRSTESLIKASMLDDAPAESLQAYKELMQIYVAAMFSQPKPGSLPTMQNPVKAAARLLKDPRTFIVDASAVVERVTGSQVVSAGESGKPTQWNVKIDGDVAIATSSTGSKAETMSGAIAGKIELRRGAAGWKISKLLMSETMLQAFETGPTVTSVVGGMPENPSPSSPGLSSPPSNTGPSSLNPANPLNRMAPPATGPSLNSDATPASPSTKLSVPSPMLNTDPNAGKPKRLPVYSGHTITVWLQEYWQSVSRSQPYGMSLTAIKTLRKQPSSDVHIKDFLASCFSKAERELDARYLGTIADTIVTVAGPQHQEQAIEYLYRLAENNSGEEIQWTPLEEFTKSYFLNAAVLALESWDERTAEQVAEGLSHGTSRQRELSLAILTASPKNFSSPAAARAAGAKRDWIAKHAGQFVPALLVASRDEAIQVRGLALSLLASVAPTHEAFEPRLRAMVESDPAIEIQSMALVNLLELKPRSTYVHDTLIEWACSGDRVRVKTALQLLSPKGKRERRDVSVAELTELLQEREWGRDVEINEVRLGKMHHTARQFAISLLGSFGEDATTSLELLQAEAGLSDAPSSEFAIAAIEQIFGYSESHPMEALAGSWRLVGMVSESGSDPYLTLKGVSDSVGIQIDGTTMSSDGNVIARIAQAIGDDPEAIRVVVKSGKSSKRFIGKCEVSKNRLKFSLQPVAEPSDPPQTHPGDSAVGFYASGSDLLKLSRPGIQFFEFRRTD